jgi:exoribonuclease-2
MEPRELAAIYFGEETTLHASAIYLALTRERERFKRKGRAFEPRSPENLAQIREQQAAQTAREAEEEGLREAIEKKSSEPALSARLERWLRGGEDRVLARVLESLWTEPAPKVFAWLLEAGHLPEEADLEVLQADLRPAHPEHVLAHVEAMAPLTTQGEVLAAAFSIDDPETREVDDVLTLTREGDEWRVDIDIADVAAWVEAGDPVDREAARRASTAYLPTGPITMLPERLGCELASLHTDAPRPALRATVWLDPDGLPLRHRLERVCILVQKRLDYETADALLAQGDEGGPLAASLGRLSALAERLAARRRAEGAFSFARTEWKVKVEPGGEIHVRRLQPDTPSRRLVAEMMILVNRLAAQEAAAAQVPLIYRVQARPSGPLPELLPDDPQAFEKLRGLLQPASLSLEPGWHFGLGVPAYTQISSPLRRYADLVAQRQLSAALSGEAPPYGQKELLKILANAESTERELKRVEAATTQRWALEWVSRQPPDRIFSAQVVAEGPGNPRVILDDCGARGVIAAQGKRSVGERLTLRAERVVPRQGICRLVPAGDGA